MQRAQSEDSTTVKQKKMILGRDRHDHVTRQVQLLLDGLPFFCGVAKLKKVYIYIL